MSDKITRREANLTDWLLDSDGNGFRAEDALAQCETHYCAEGYALELNEMHLEIGEPNFWPTFSLDEYLWKNDACVERLPDDVQAALNEFNAALKACKEPLSLDFTGVWAEFTPELVESLLRLRDDPS